jgi:S-adenosylmethionine decarboxylase
MGTDSMTPEEQKQITKKVFREIKEIFYGRNLPEVK